MRYRATRHPNGAPGTATIAAMEHGRTMEHRLMELEVKASFADDLLDHLNAQVARQQEQIDLLLREVALLRRQRPEDDSVPAPSAQDERPPHY
jgi:SlyX protein